MSPNNQGYVAVVTAIIITTAAIIIAAAVSSSNFLGRFDTQTAEFKAVSRRAAEACLEHARLELAFDLGYGGGEIINVSEYSCEVLPIETLGADKVIKATSEVEGQKTNLRLTVDGETLETISLEEVNMLQ